MRALVGGRWQDGYLDYHRRPGECRVRTIAQCELLEAGDMFFAPPRRLGLLADYLREVGPAAVVRKVRSRLSERARNEKSVSIGIGEVLERAEGGRFGIGDLVAFVAPAHPPAVERLSLPPGLLRQAPAGAPAVQPGVLHVPRGRLSPDAAAAAEALAGWHPESGVELGELAWAVDALAGLVSGCPWHAARRLPSGPAGGPLERREARGAARGVRPSAVLFGYGNYARSYVLPGVAGAFSVDAVHELDPLKLGHSLDDAVTWDTSPQPRDGERYDAWLLAGYHHTHAPLAVQALGAGAAVVVEKPLATTPAQAEALAAAAREGRVYACFQRRYSPLTALAIEDLGGADCGPVSYHCIVHEVPLPARHWYRWPASGSRLVSNGCHWVDHFLWVNGYAPVADAHVVSVAGGTLVCGLALENGAGFSMVLTETGSSRTGVQDHVELRTPDRTVRIVNDSDYAAEATSGTIRRLRQRRTRSYERMYREIARRVADGEPGDDADALAVSAGAVLRLERELRGSTAAAD